MATITHNGTSYGGRSPESIARRVWGRRVDLRPNLHLSMQWGQAYEAMITRTDRHGTHVLATVVVRP